MKDKILLFVEKAYMENEMENITMDSVAKSMKISKKTIYKYYKSKNEIISKILLKKVDFIEKNLDLIIKKNIDPIKKLCEIKEFIHKNIGISNNFLEDFKKISNKWWKEIDNVRNKILSKNLTYLINEGKEKELIINVPSEFIIKIFISAISYTINPKTFEKLNVMPSEMISLTMSILFKGIFTSKGLEKYLLYNKGLTK